jgi:biopolymer transport protein ExbB/TolQ
MALFFTVTLAVSIAGMLLLLGFKRYELSSGKLLFVSGRPAIGNFFKRVFWWIEKVLPALVRVYGRRAFRFAKAALQRGLARSILWLERTLEHILRTVREKTETPRAPGEASAFLREVAEHKRKLSRRIKKQPTKEE